jgi:hypothetical protein
MPSTPYRMPMSERSSEHRVVLVAAAGQIAEERGEDTRRTGRNAGCDRVDARHDLVQLRIPEDAPRGADLHAVDEHDVGLVRSRLPHRRQARPRANDSQVGLTAQQFGQALLDGRAAMKRWLCRWCARIQLPNSARAVDSQPGIWVVSIEPRRIVAFVAEWASPNHAFSSKTFCSNHSG